MQDFIDFPGMLFRELLFNRLPAPEGLFLFLAVYWMLGYLPGMLILLAARCLRGRAAVSRIWFPADWVGILAPFLLWIGLSISSGKEGGNLWEPIWTGWFWSILVFPRLLPSYRNPSRTAGAETRAWMAALLTICFTLILLSFVPPLRCSFYLTP